MFSNRKKKFMFRAIKSDDATAVRKILIEDNSAHPDAVYEIYGTYGTIIQKYTPLTYAIETDAAKSFDIILAAGADVNLSAEKGTPLIEAARKNRPHYIDKLLAAGADVNMQSESGETALMLAAANNATACLDKLLAAGADVNMQSESGTTALMGAIMKNATGCLNKLLAAGADVNMQNGHGGTALMYAASKNAPECLDKLLAAGADVNMQSESGITALMAAAGSNAPECLDKLLAAGADVNMQNRWVTTAVMEAAENNHIECTKQLLSAGATIQVKNHRGETAEDIAMKMNHTAIVELLKKHQRQQRQPPNPPPQPATSQSGPSAPPLSFPDAPPPPPPPPPPNQQGYHSQELEISFSELSIGDDLGRGSFGVVRLAELHQTQVAVKMFLTFGHDDPRATGVLQEMQREAKLLGNLRHPNVVSMMGICTTPPCIVMDYCSKGSLFEVIASARSQTNNMHNQLTWKRRVGLVRDIALGMTFLHSRQEPVIHRDLKSPNILIDGNWTGKVADLNLSRAIKKVDESGRMAAMSSVSRPTDYRWLAPELLDPDTRASGASDVYALGIMMWELLTWQIPFGPSIEPAAMVACLLRGKTLQVPALNELPGPEPASAFPGLNRYIQLMKQCWSQDPKKRPTMAEVASALRELWTALPSTTDGNVAAAGGAAGGAAAGAPSNEATECAICYDQKAVIALIHHNTNQGNIAHMCCAECAEKLQSLGQNCPMCQRPIDGTVRVF